MLYNERGIVDLRNLKTCSQLHPQFWVLFDSRARAFDSRAAARESTCALRCNAAQAVWLCAYREQLVTDSSIITLPTPNKIKNGYFLWKSSVEELCRVSRACARHFTIWAAAGKLSCFVIVQSFQLLFSCSCFISMICITSPRFWNWVYILSSWVKVNIISNILQLHLGFLFLKLLNTKNHM